MKKKQKVEIEVKATPETEVKSAMTNPMQGVKFWLFTIGAALLLVMGIWILVDKNFGSSLAVAFTGIVIILFGLIRIIPLVKSRKTGTAKVITTLEIVINLALGIFLVFAAIQIRNENTIGNFVNDYYRYFLGFVFYAKGIFYFINSSLLKEETNKIEFWLHIVIITIAVVIFATNFDATNLAILIAVLALLCAVFLIGMSGGSYYNYRKTLNKKPKKEKNNEKNDLNDEETNQEDEIILPNNEKNNDETYVN